MAVIYQQELISIERGLYSKNRVQHFRPKKILCGLKKMTPI